MVLFFRTSDLIFFNFGTLPIFFYITVHFIVVVVVVAAAAAVTKVPCYQ